MSNMSYEQIEREFLRQVRLCAGISVERMVEMIRVERGREHEFSECTDGTRCRKCGKTVLAATGPCR